jgi:hypothetical protein
MTSINEKLSLCFVKLNKLEGEHDACEFFTGEGPRNWNPFPYCSPNMLHCLPKVGLNEFDGFDLTI